MIQYIDKDEALKELTSLKGKVDDGSSYANGWAHALRMMEIFINNNSKILPNTTRHLQEKDDIYKTLLIKDLCARLPYGVIVDIKYNKEHGSSDRLRICSEGSLMLNTDLIGLCIEKEIHLKPYLRSFTSLTNQECQELGSLQENAGFKLLNPGYSGLYSDYIHDLIDFLYRHHFDYRGLIEKGLALEAPEGMYKTE